MRGAAGKGCLKQHPAPEPLHWALSASPLPLLYRGSSTGQCRGEEAATRRLLDSIQKSYLVFTGRNLSPAIDKWRMETQSCREGKVFAHLDLGWPCLLLNLLLFTFSCDPSPAFFSSSCRRFGNSWWVCVTLTGISPTSRAVPLTRH